MSNCLCQTVYVTLSISCCLCHAVYVTLSMSRCLYHAVYVTLYGSHCLCHPIWVTLSMSRCLGHAVYVTLYGSHSLCHAVYVTLYGSQCLCHAVYLYNAVYATLSMSHRLSYSVYVILSVYATLYMYVTLSMAYILSVTDCLCHAFYVTLSMSRWQSALSDRDSLQFGCVLGGQHQGWLSDRRTVWIWMSVWTQTTAQRICRYLKRHSDRNSSKALPMDQWHIQWLMMQNYAVTPVRGSVKRNLRSSAVTNHHYEKLLHILCTHARASAPSFEYGIIP